MYIAKHWIRSQAGMTLLEMVLAMTMLAIVTLGASGFATGTLRASKMGQQKMNLQQDVGFTFRRIENSMLQFQNGRDLRYVVSFVFGAAGDLTVTMGVADALSLNLFFIRMVYSSAVNGTNPTKTNYMETQIFAMGPGITPERFMINGFKPWARLKDYDLSGVIDSVDAAKRTACLQTLTAEACFDVTECAASAVGANHHFGYGSPSLLKNVSQACLDKSVFPFMELSKDRALYYFSFQPWNESAHMGVNAQKLPGFTKTIALHPVE